MASAELGTVLQQIRRMVSKPNGETLTDIQLLDGFRAHQDQAAFALLVKRHGPMVLKVCRHVLHHHQDAEDAFQATFLVLARGAATIRKKTGLASWLHGVAYRMAMNAKRSAARRRKHERKGGMLSPATTASDSAVPGRAGESMAPRPSRDPAWELGWREVQAILDEEIERLPEKYRAAFVLCCLEGIGRAEAGRQLGLKEGTVSSRLDQARKRLQQRLARRGVMLSSVLAAAAITENAATAAVAPFLVNGTVQAAQLLAAGQTGAAGAISANVVRLVEAAGRAMLMTKLRIATALLFAVGTLAGGVGLAAQQILVVKPTEDKPQAVKPADAAQPRAIAEKEKQMRTDRYGDPLPPGALVRMGTVRLRHAGHAFSVAFLPDGKTFVSGGYDGKVFLWDVGTGKKLQEFAAQEISGGIDAVAVSSDGKTLASGGDKILRLWDVLTAKEVFSCKGHLKRILSVVFSPDGKLLASGSEDETIRLWDVSTGKQVRSWKAHGEWGVRTVAFSPDGQTLASVGCGDRMIQLWETATGRHLRQLRESGGGMSAICFSPDGKTLISGSNGFAPICVWETATARLLKQFGKTNAAVWSLSVSADAKILAAGGSDGNCRLWELATGQLIREFHGNGEDLYSVALSPNAQVLAAASRDHAIYLWDVAMARELHPFSSHRFFLTSAVFTPDGKGLLTGGFDRSIRLWDSATGNEIRQYPNVGDYVASLDVSPDGRTLAAGSCRPSRFVAKKPDNLAVRLWDVVTGKELHPLGEHAGPYIGVTFSPDGKMLAVKDGAGVLHLWDLTKRQECCRVEGLVELDHYGVAFSPDGKSVACRKDNNMICLWNTATGKLVGEFRAPQQGVRSLVFSPDGKTLFAGGYTQPIRLWEVASGKERLHFEGSPVHVTGIALSPDGRTLASASYYPHPIRLWDTVTGEMMAEREMTAVEALAFSPDGQRLASAGSDGTALVWEVASVTTREQPPSKPLSLKQFDTLWDDLAGGDAGRAYRAIGTLVISRDESVSLLKKHLTPVPAVDNKHLRRLIADLDSDQFAVREAADKELDKLGELAVPACRQALEKKPSAEMRRLEAFLEKQAREEWPASPMRLRPLRAVEVLEHIATPEAQQVLQSLAKGAPEARLTQEARFSLDRLQKRAAKKP